MALPPGSFPGARSPAGDRVSFGWELFRAIAPDPFQRCFSGDAPDSPWVADITFVHTDQGFAYLASVFEAFSHRIVG